MYNIKNSIIFISIGIIILALCINRMYLTFQLSIDQIMEIDKCPACFGTSACNFIERIDITPHNSLSFFHILFGIKNVYYGVFGKILVIIKKLAHVTEFNEFDNEICNIMNLSFCNNNIHDRENILDFDKLIENELSANYTRHVHMRLCPQIKHLQDLLSNFYFNNQNINNDTLKIHLWTLIKLNPEPIVLQILPASENWPVPKYHGSCGRVIVEENFGSPLADQYYKPWLHRAKIASSLLRAANMFTHRSDKFGFYFTDISIDNIAIDEFGNAKFIDVEDIIVVDKKIMQNRNIHSNDDNGTDSFIFSPQDICNHYLSDHNYYAICKTILSPNMKGFFHGGLLHNIPTKFMKEYPSLLHLLNECDGPTYDSRIIIGNQLEELLNKIVHINQ